MLTWPYLQSRGLMLLWHAIWAGVGLAAAYGANWLNGQHLGNYSPVIAVGTTVAVQHVMAVLQDAMSQIPTQNPK